MAGRKGDLNVRGAFVHLIADAAISLGVVIAAGVIAVTGWLWLDPAVSLVIAVAIIAGTWSLFRDSVDLVLDAVPRHVDRAAVETYLAVCPASRRCMTSTSGASPPPRSPSWCTSSARRLRRTMPFWPK